MGFLKKAICFLYIFFIFSFVIGTFVVELIIRSFITYIRLSGWMITYEKWIMGLIIFVTLLFSALFAKWLTKWIMGPKNSLSKYLFLIFITLAALTILGYWLMPRKILLNQTIISRDKRFIGGIYPTKEMLLSLKAKGYTAVISLLDPFVLPREPLLILQEKYAAKNVGIALIRIPMLPGRIKSQQAESQIIALAETNNHNKYYVHGYYGNERIDLFMDLINQYSRVTPEVKTYIPTVKTYDFTRGLARQIDNHLIISPKPTDDEFKQYILSTPNKFINVPIRSIISLDPDENLEAVNQLKTRLTEKDIEYVSNPISTEPYDALKVLSIARKVKLLPSVVMVYAYYMPPQSMVMSGFIISYLTNMPALPKALFAVPMQGGAVEVLAPNIAAGPEPVQDEITDYLRVRGIRGLIFVGTCQEKSLQSNKRAAKSAHLIWACFSSKQSQMYKILSSGGPWYIYGPESSKIYKEIYQRFGKFKPDPSLLGR